MPFEIREPYPPSGDQPDAIAQLAAGLQRGEEYQTLLGVTGSGKSLAWDEPVMIRARWSDGSFRVSLRPIGPLVDAACGAGGSKLLDSEDTQVALPLEDVEALSFNPQSGATEWRRITGFSRHAAPPMFRVRTACGREVTATGDHNFFSLRDGGLQLSRTTDLNREDYLPLPGTLEPSRCDLEFMDLGDLCPLGSGNLQRLVPVSNELLTFLGLMLSGGAYDDGGYASFHEQEEELKEEFLRCTVALGIPTRILETGDVVILSHTWGLVASQLLGSGSQEHLPSFWPALSGRQLATLLRAYSEDQGVMGRMTLRMTTPSRRLASELSYAFLNFGITASLQGHRESVQGREPHHAVVLRGKDSLWRFAGHIDFLSERKKRMLRAQVDPLEGRNMEESIERQEIEPFEAFVSGKPRVELFPSGGLDTLAVQGLPGYRARGQHGRLRCGQMLGSLSSDARWTPVQSVEPVEYAHPFVYDLSVAGNETFLAGHGGLFVHNTYTVANVIQQWKRPTLVISHNKTLAAQLYGEFRQFFPDNAVGYFISYYDYYQPEAYVPSTNTYIAKDATINDDIDRLRLQATSMLLERDDVIIVASVSCIYGLGTPEDWSGMRLDATAGARASRKEILEKLVSIQYTRNDLEVARGTFRARGDVIEVHPAYEDTIVRIELDDDVVARISAVDPVTGKMKRRMDRLALYPAKHFVTPEPRLMTALDAIRAELDDRLDYFRANGKLLEAQRLKQRTEYDLEMLATIGTCPGVENYSRHLSGRQPGERPGCLIDYFPDDFLLVVDESHVTVPQIGGMYEGDRSRKQILVDFGFRLPSALDNRPLRFDEFEQLTGPTLFVSATPADYELRMSKGVVVEQIIRPTGLVDPEVVVKPVQGQVDDLLEEIRQRVANRERILVTTLTKRMAEDLTDYLGEMGVKVRYLHSDIDALERVEILRGLRLADFDVLVGINLLREGLDLPEVSLVAILDADKEGFLRSERSLIQTSGRAARNVNGRVILYADSVTDSMRRALDETDRRRTKQLEYNAAHGIVPRTVEKSIEDVLRATSVADAAGEARAETVHDMLASLGDESPEALIRRLEVEMLEAARQLEFERAASLRDRIEEVRGAMAAAERMGVVRAGTPSRPGDEGERRGRGGAHRSRGPRRGRRPGR